MNYRLTCLTPTLVGDGQKLAPIDYMVWKEHVNVLDQRRIFRLLAKGPRLDGYLSQLKKADKLDFAHALIATCLLVPTARSSPSPRAERVPGRAPDRGTPLG